MLSSNNFKIKMLNIDSTRNHFKIIEVCFNMLRHCAYTHGTWIRSTVDRLFTLLNNGWAYPCGIIWSLFNMRSHLCTTVVGQPLFVDD